MDTYKWNLISLIERRSLLWDPSHVYYKNKEQRQLAWEEIERVLPAPYEGITAKHTWESLNRGYSNALRRKERNSGNGASYDKSWKFEEAMGFLLVARKNRNGLHFPTNDEENGTDFDYDNTAESVDDSTIDRVMERSEVHRSLLIEDALDASPTPPIVQWPRKRKADELCSKDMLIHALSERMADKKESSRIAFFRANESQLNELNDEEFIDLQMLVLNFLKQTRASKASRTTDMMADCP